MIFDWVYLAVLATVFGVAVTIAYARGYRAGHDDGFTEAVLNIEHYIDKGFDKGRRRD